MIRKTEKEIFTAGYLEGVTACNTVGEEALKDVEFHYNIYNKKQKIGERKMTREKVLKVAISMLNKDILPFIVVAFRGDNFYLVGAVCDVITAQRLAHDETDLRDGKYTCKVINLWKDFRDEWNRICEELGASNATSEEMLGI